MQRYQRTVWGLALATLAMTLASGAGMARAAASATWYDCRTREAFTPDKQQWCDRWQTLQSASYTVPTSTAADPGYTTVTLEDGTYQQVDGPLQVVLVNEANWLAFGDINGDGRTDAGTIIGVAPDGVTLGTYLAVVLDVDGAARPLAPVRLGERIILNGPITMAEATITVPQLTQTAVINRTFQLDGDTLIELNRIPGPEALSMALPDATLVLSQTPQYAVRVFSQNGTPRINLFNKVTGQLELANGAAVIESASGGTTYRHGGTPAVVVQVSSSGAQTIEVNGQALQGYDQVTGTVTYGQRIALPPEAVVEVTLVDVSRADAPAVVLAQQTLMLGDRQVPIPFELLYDPTQIDPRFTYAVQARITVEGQLRFINTTRFAVITQDHPTTVDVLVDPVN